jgi:hypothetical protein
MNSRGRSPLITTEQKGHVEFDIGGGQRGAFFIEDAADGTPTLRRLNIV